MRSRPIFMKAFSLLFLAFILALIVLADTGSLPPFIRALYRFPYGDKAGHFILFGLLNFFLTQTVLSSNSNPRRRLAAVSMGLILALFIALEEWSQQFFASRTFDLRDLLASWLGALLGGWAAWRIK
ncbi:MAG: VanZ family protein [Chloroflexi bacterium]|nr:VanZ family protein [Chloroflexota bacterium]